jgi:hypothetical protein
MPALYRYSTLRDEQTGKKRTFWVGGVLSNTPMRELISQHKKYWSDYIKETRHDEIWDGEKGLKIPALDVYIADVWPAKLLDEQVPSDNDFVESRKTDLILLDKTEYEESVTKMITRYMELVTNLLNGFNEKDRPAAAKAVLDRPIIDGALNRKGINTYRDLLKGNFDIDRVMRIERKDDLYSIGYAMEDFSIRTINQLLTVGKYDTLDKLIHSLSHTVKSLQKVSQDTKESLLHHLDDASKALGSNNTSFPYDEVMNNLYGFIDQIKTIESTLGKDQVALLRP